MFFHPACFPIHHVLDRLGDYGAWKGQKLTARPRRIILLRPLRPDLHHHRLLPRPSGADTPAAPVLSFVAPLVPPEGLPYLDLLLCRYLVSLVVRGGRRDIDSQWRKRIVSTLEGEEIAAGGETFEVEGVAPGYGCGKGAAGT